IVVHVDGGQGRQLYLTARTGADGQVCRNVSVSGGSRDAGQGAQRERTARALRSEIDKAAEVAGAEGIAGDRRQRHLCAATDLERAVVDIGQVGESVGAAGEGSGTTAVGGPLADRQRAGPVQG